MIILSVIITPLVFSIIVGYLLFPLVNYLEKQKISRTGSIITIYLFFAVIFLTLCLYFVPVLLNELKELMEVIPQYAENFTRFVERMDRDYQRFHLPPPVRAAFDENINQAKNALVINIEEFSSIIMFVLEQIFALLLVPIFAFYVIRDEALFKNNFLKLIPQKHRFRVEKTLQDINKTLGSYLRGVFIVSFSVGFLVYVGLLLLGVEFALFLGVVNGLSNIIPYFGPLIGALPVLVVALLQSVDLVWKSLVLLFVVQQIEGFFIAPQFFGRNLDFHPLSIIIALLLGGKFFGFLGLILIVPVIAVLRIVFQHFSPLLIEIFTKQS